MRPGPREESGPRCDQDGYAIRLCTCEEGAYLGARLGGTPCRCERCGFITLDQWEYIVERIVGERVRVVEGERDAWKRERDEYVSSICFETTCTNCAHMLDQLAATREQNGRESCRER